VAHHLQRLEWNHDLVVFHEIAGKEQQLCGFHCFFLPSRFAMRPASGVKASGAIRDRPAVCEQTRKRPCLLGMAFSR
jgi:hypothetical protein